MVEGSEHQLQLAGGRSVAGSVGQQQLSSLVIVMERLHRRMGGRVQPIVDFFPHNARQVLRRRTRRQPPDFR